MKLSKLRTVSPNSLDTRLFWGCWTLHLRLVALFRCYSLHMHICTHSFCYPIVRCFNVTRLSWPDTDVSFCWTKSVVSTAGNAVTLFINLAGNLYKSFHTVIFISAVTLLHILPETWLSICISRFTRSLSYPMLRCYTLSN